MLESFYIHNFKNIWDLNIPQLKRVNLIVGKNNVGKSTFLEAVALYLSKGDEGCIKETLCNRGEDVYENSRDADFEQLVKEHYLSLFPDREENYSRTFKILIGEDATKILKISQVYVSLYKDENDSSIRRIQAYSQEDLDELVGTTEISTNGLLVETQGLTNVIRYNRSALPSSFVKNRLPYQMVRTLDFEHEKNAMLFDKVSLSEDDVYIIQALNIINPQIDRLTFVSEDYRGRIRVPVVSLKGGGKRVRLSSMGDGVNRVLTIILSLLNAKNGVLLLDEFETGLHYSVQLQLWEIIFLLAEKLNVQVFVTTHSSDCLRTFSKANTAEQGMLIRLEQRKAGIVPICYTDNSDIAFAAGNNIELR